MSISKNFSGLTFETTSDCIFYFSRDKDLV